MKKYIKSLSIRNTYNPSMKVSLMGRIDELIQELHMEVQDTKQGIIFLGLDLRSTNVLWGAKEKSFAPSSFRFWYSDLDPALNSQGDADFNTEFNMDLTLSVHLAGVHSGDPRRIFPSNNSYWVYTIRPDFNGNNTAQVIQWPCSFKREKY